MLNSVTIAVCEQILIGKSPQEIMASTQIPQQQFNAISRTIKHYPPILLRAYIGIITVDDLDQLLQDVTEDTLRSPRSWLRSASSGSLEQVGELLGIGGEDGYAIPENVFPLIRELFLRYGVKAPVRERLERDPVLGAARVS